jgi:hypothetical protein
VDLASWKVFQVFQAITNMPLSTSSAAKGDLVQMVAVVVDETVGQCRRL